LKFNQKAIVQVISSQKLQMLECIVKLKQRVTFARKFKILNKKSATITFSPSSTDWAPSAKLLIFYYTASGEIVSDVVDIEINELSSMVIKNLHSRALFLPIHNVSFAD
jgi:hypothetical protein